MLCSRSVALVRLVIWLHLRRLSVYQGIVRNPGRLPSCLGCKEDFGTVEKRLHESKEMLQQSKFRRTGAALAAP